MATRKEDEIQIPESVLNRANRSAIEAAYGITGQERDRYNIPRFPSSFGLNPNPQFGYGTYQMAFEDFPATRMEERVANYSRDSGTRMANRYTMPVSDLGVSDFRSGGFRTQLPTSRVGATAYSSPEMASNLEREKSEYIQPTQGVGQSGFGREYTFGNREVQQIVSPYGLASTTLTPQQVEQRSQVRQQAEQMGTMPRTPEQQQALLAQMRQQGSQIRERIGGIQESLFAQGRAQREALNTAEQEARAAGASSMDILRARSAVAGPSTIAGIQQQATIGPMAPVGTTVAQFKRALPAGGRSQLPVGPMGPSGYALYEQQQAGRRAAGLTGPYSNVRAEQRRRIRDEAQAFGLPAATNLQMQEAQEDYLRRRRNAV